MLPLLRRTRLAAALLLTAALLVGAPAPSAADSVANAQAAADDATERFIAAQADAHAIDAAITDIEGRIEAAQQEAGEARDLAQQRAVSIYMASGADFVTVFESADAMEAARRAQLVGNANDDSQQVFERLSAVTEDLEERHAELADARAEQGALVETLAAEQQALDAELARVQAEYRAEQARLADAATSITTAPLATAAEPERPGATAAAPGTAGTTDPPATTAATTTPPTTTPPTTATPSSEPQPVSAPPDTGRVHPHHNDPFLVCTRTRESSGNYQAENPNGLYFGAYQFHQSTWDGAASHAGRPELIGVVPSHASPYDQDDVAWDLYQWQGNTPWNGLC